MTKHSASHVRRRVVAVCIAICASYVAARFESLAQEREGVTIDARRCMDLESPDERLACFEAQVKDAGSEHSESNPPPVDTAASRAERRSTSPAEAARSSRRDDARVAPAQSELVGNIAALEPRARDRYRITLDTGDVFEQRFAERYTLRVGQRVRIYRSQWGDSERLQADGVNGFIQVVRVP
jgi:hypothetical protein